MGISSCLVLFIVFFSAHLIKIENMKPDAVMTTVAGADLIAMIEQATEFGIDNKIPFCFTLRDYTDAWAIGLKGNFGVFGITWYHFLDVPGVKDFIDRFKKRWPKAPIPVPENVTYNGYMGARELLRAVERAGTTRSRSGIVTAGTGASALYCSVSRSRDASQLMGRVCGT